MFYLRFVSHILMNYSTSWLLISLNSIKGIILPELKYIRDNRHKMFFNQVDRQNILLKHV